MNKLLIGLVVAVLATLGTVYVLDRGVTLGTEINESTTGTNTSLVASSTSAQALASNSGARKRVFSNTGSNVIYLSEKTTSTFVAGTGIALFAGTRYEETSELGNLWTGTVWAITASGTSSLVIQQL